MTKKSTPQNALVEQQPRNTLYHYTSVSSFLAICEARSLRASELKSLNDPREVSLGSELLENYISELGYPKPGPQQDHLTSLRQSYLDQKDDFALFGVSLSRSRDSLPQWLEYGDRGRGICLGFKEQPFDIERLSFVARSEVAYSQAQFLKSVQDAFLASEETWTKNCANWDEDDIEEHCFSAALALLSNCASYKHHTWEHEQEVRFIAMTYRFGLAHKTKYVLPDEAEAILGTEWPKFRERAGHIIPYIDLPLGKPVSIGDSKDDVDAVFVLDEVIIGPICPADTDVVGAVLNKGKRQMHCSKLSRSECNIRP